jgi:hypothetical protein
MRIIHSMEPERAPAFSAQPDRPVRPSLDARVAAMRRSGMSGTAIRRALGLSPAQAVAAGIVAPTLKPVEAGSPARGARGAAAGPSMAEVLAAVARASGLAPEDLLRPERNRRTVQPRQLAMYLLRTLCAGASLPAIGYFLGRDHSTVLYGCRKAEALLQRDAAFQALCARARNTLAAPPAGVADEGDVQTPA